MFFEVYHTVQLKIMTGQGLGGPGIRGPEAVGIFYQHISTVAPIQSLREILSARPDLGPPARDRLMIYYHEEKYRTDLLQNDKSLQSYGITEGSEIFLRQYWRNTECSAILFEKENVRYESGAFVQLRPTDGRPTFGLMLGIQDDQVKIIWVHEQKDIEATLLRDLLREYKVHLHEQELFLSDKLSFQPIAEVLNKVTVLLVDLRNETPEPKAEQYYIRFRYRVPAPHPSTWTVEEVSEKIRAVGCPAAADLLVEKTLMARL